MFSWWTILRPGLQLLSLSGIAHVPKRRQYAHSLLKYLRFGLMFTISSLFSLSSQLLAFEESCLAAFLSYRKKRESVSFRGITTKIPVQASNERKIRSHTPDNVLLMNNFGPWPTASVSEPHNFFYLYSLYLRSFGLRGVMPRSLFFLYSFHFYSSSLRGVMPRSFFCPKAGSFQRLCI